MDIYSVFSVRNGRNVKIEESLCFYNPREVYDALMNNEKVLKWLKFISEIYTPPFRKVLLIYPCASVKPYSESRSYKRLYATLRRLGDLRRFIHVATVSEPLGLVPEEFYGDSQGFLWYDCPGLFEWWCKKFGQKYEEEFVEKSIDVLASYVAKFLKRVGEKGVYEKIVAFVKTYSSSLHLKKDHTHRRIIEKAKEISGVDIEILPPRRLVAKIVALRGRFAWDVQGISHPIAQEYLFNYLMKVLGK